MSSRKRYLALGLIALLVALLPLYISQYYISIAVLVVINIILASSIRVCLMAGLFNMAQGAFMGIGAYVSALMVMNLGVPFPLALLCAGIVSVLISIIIGYPALHTTKGIYFALVTIAFVEVVRIIESMWSGLTGGPSGIIYIPKPSLFAISLESTNSSFYLAIGLLAICLFVLYRLEISRIGLTWKAIGMADLRAESIGVNLLKHRIFALAVSSFFAGIAGSLYAHFITSIFPQSFGFTASVYALVYTWIGGRHRFIGPILGAAFLTVASEPFRGVTYYEMLFFSLLMMLTIVLFPQGIVTLPQRVSAFIRWLPIVHRKSARMPIPASTSLE